MSDANPNTGDRNFHLKLDLRVGGGGTEVAAVSLPHVARDTEGFPADKREDISRIATALKTINASLGISELTALLAIAANPGLSVNEMAAELAVPQQTASRHIRNLADRQKGITAGTFFELRYGPARDPLVVQEINPMEPRRRALYLTTVGHDVVEALLTALSSQSESPR